MNEKRFRAAYENYGVWDKVLCKKLSYEELIDLLNEQQSMIDQLEKENTALLDLAEALGVKIVEADDE